MMLKTYLKQVIPAASIAALAQCRELTELHLNCESDFDLAPLSHLRKLARIVTFLPGVGTTQVLFQSPSLHPLCPHMQAAADHPIASCPCKP